MKNLMLTLFAAAAALTTLPVAAGNGAVPVPRTAIHEAMAARRAPSSLRAPQPSFHQFLKQSNLSLSDNSLMAKAPRHQTSLNSSNLDATSVPILYSGYDFMGWKLMDAEGLELYWDDADGGMVEDPVWVGGNLVSIFVHQDNNCQCIASDFYKEFDLPYLADFDSGEANIEMGLVVDSVLKCKVFGRYLYDTLTVTYIVPEQYLYPFDDEEYGWVDYIEGETYEDGSVYFEGGFSFVSKVSTKVTLHGTGQLQHESEYWEVSPVFRNTYLLVPNGIHEYKMAEVAEPVVDPDPVPDPVDPDTVNTDTTSTSPFVLPSSIGGKIVRLPVADTHGGKRKVPQKPTSVHPTPGVTTNIVINPIIDPFVSSSNNGKIVSSGRMKNLISELINEIINGGKPKIPKKPTSLRPGLQSESWNPFLDTSLSSPSPRPSGEMTEPDTLYQMPVYIFQTTCDTVDYTAVCVYGLYGRINENPMDLNKVNVMNVMHIYPDGTMEFPEQVVGCIKSLSRSVESNYSATTPTLDDLTPGNTGVWTPQDITWDITVLKPVYVDLSSFDGEFGDWTPWRPWQPWNPGDNSGVRSSSTIDTYYYDNRLYLNNGGEFGLFNFEQGGRSVRNIGDVTDMIERALNGDTSVNIKAITDAINQIINR